MINSPMAFAINSPKVTPMIFHRRGLREERVRNEEDLSLSCSYRIFEKDVALGSAVRSSAITTGERREKLLPSKFRTEPKTCKEKRLSVCESVSLCFHRAYHHREFRFENGEHRPHS